MWRFFGACFLGFLFLHGFCASDKAPDFSFVHNASSAPVVSYYDYIIVGGGTSGCPLAATLSQNASVLVLERGGSPYGNPNITYLVNFGNALLDHSPTSPSQEFISEDGVVNARARVLGGGSSINAGFYSRASIKYIRDMRWDEVLVKESYEWVEKVVAFEPKLGPWQSAVRNGLLEVGVVPYNGFTYDHICGTKIGGTIFDQDGHRHTAADLLGYANPSRLTVLLQASVQKILFKTNGTLRPMAYGVVYKDESGAIHKAYLNNGSKNEIIATAGALGSPQLLMLSGLGPLDQLKAHNITVVKEQAMVGQLMSDNPMNGVTVPSPIPVEFSLIEVAGITPFDTYIESLCGVNYINASQSNSGMFSPKIGQLSIVPPQERIAKSLAKAIELMDNPDQQAFKGGFVLEKVRNPISIGYLELRTTNPNDNPSVRFNYFKEAQDLQTCVKGMSIVVNVIDSKSFSKFRYANISTPELLNMPPNSTINSTSLERYCKDTVRTIWHYHGGCQRDSVVDFNYKVLGVDALRVIDGSTFNISPGTNPQATVMMLGRYMGVKILNERLATKE